ncbi:MAG: hypothetical protein P8P87_04980 [Crocinitomicaceae bacterium]|nr:hypothetical protein [Crocinitomicaceae bacterium]
MRISLFVKVILLCSFQVGNKPIFEERTEVPFIQFNLEVEVVRSLPIGGYNLQV